MLADCMSEHVLGLVFGLVHQFPLIDTLFPGGASDDPGVSGSDLTILERYLRVGQIL
jgi:hypothetical protein